MKLALVGLLLLSGMEGVALWAAPPTLPNILLILVEDVGAWELGCYGGAAAETPNLDQMAEEGMRFSAAYAASCVGGPSRASAMTGKSPVRLRFTEDLRGGGVAGALQPAGSGAGLSGDDVTFAETLREAGYRTAYVGPWGLGLGAGAPERHGFEVVSGAAAVPQSFFSPFGLPDLGDSLPGTHLGERLTTEALRFMSAAKEKPFLLCFSWPTSHRAEDQRSEILEKVKARAGEGAGVDARVVAAAGLEALDAAVGQMVERLRELDLTKKTIVVFHSASGRWQSSGAEDEAMRGVVGTLWEGGLRVPLIVRWPSVLAGGALCRVPVISTDLYWTFVELARGVPPVELEPDGQSMLPLFKNVGGAPRPFFWHFPHYHESGGRPSSAIRVGDWKLVENFEDSSAWLVNLIADPTESTDLSGKWPKRTAALREQLKAWRDQSLAAMPSANAQPPPGPADVGAAAGEVPGGSAAGPR